MKRVGVDIGGTQLRCAIFDQDGNILEKFKIRNDRSLSAKENLDRLIAFINRRNEEFQFHTIGIGCPGPLNLRLGKILNPPNLNEDWCNLEIVKYFEEKTGIKTFLNGDGKLAGLAEATLGAGKGYESVFYITISTGVGGAYIYRGEIMTGANAMAGEVYNLMVCDDPYHRKNALPGSTNENCSGSALERMALERYGHPVSCKDLFQLYYQGDPIAVELVEQKFILGMARAIGNISCIVDPDIFVLGGSIANKEPIVFDKLCEKAKEFVPFPQFLRIRHAQFEDDAGLIGTALLEN